MTGFLGRRAARPRPLAAMSFDKSIIYQVRRRYWRTRMYRGCGNGFSHLADLSAGSAEARLGRKDLPLGCGAFRLGSADLPLGCGAFRLGSADLPLGRSRVPLGSAKAPLGRKCFIHVDYAVAFESPAAPRPRFSAARAQVRVTIRGPVYFSLRAGVYPPWRVPPCPHQPISVAHDTHAQ